MASFDLVAATIKFQEAIKAAGHKSRQRRWGLTPPRPLLAPGVRSGSAAPSMGVGISDMSSTPEQRVDFPARRISARVDCAAEYAVPNLPHLVRVSLEFERA